MIFKEYVRLEYLSRSQIEEINNFNNNSSIQYENLINCEICSSKKISVLFNNDRYGINQKTCVCNNCGLMFSNPRMTQKSTEYFYNSDLYRLIYDGIGKNFDKEEISAPYPWFFTFDYVCFQACYFQLGAPIY